MTENTNGLMNQSSSKLHGDDAVSHVISLLETDNDYAEAQLTPLQESIVRLEGFHLKPEKEITGQTVVGVGQTGIYADMTFPEVFQAKEAEARKLFPNYDNYNFALKKAIMSGTYRGDFKKGHKTVELINDEHWAEAGRMFLRNSADDGDSLSYASSKTNPNLAGVKTRLENISNTLKAQTQP